jgi:hypothetical protein
VAGLEYVISIGYDSPLCYTLVDTFMNDLGSMSISDNDYTRDIGTYPELCVRGRLSLSSTFVPSIEVSIYPSLEDSTPFTVDELRNVGVRMEIEYRETIYYEYAAAVLAKWLSPAARHGVLEVLDQTYDHSTSGPIVYPEPVLPLSGAWPERYFTHPESGQTSPFPPSLELMPDGTGEFYYPIFTHVLIVRRR